MQRQCQFFRLFQGNWVKKWLFSNYNFLESQIVFVEKFFEMLHFVRNLILNQCYFKKCFPDFDTLKTFGIRLRHREKIFNSKNDTLYNFNSKFDLKKSVRVVQCKNANNKQILWLLQKKKIKTCFFSNHNTFQNLILQLEVWHFMKNWTQNPWCSKYCFSEVDTLEKIQLQIWHVKKLSFQYLTSFKNFNSKAFFFWDFAVRIFHFIKQTNWGKFRF